MSSPQAPGERVAREVAIVNKKGLHARASAKFVREAEAFQSTITVSRNGESVGATSIMGLMMLAAGPGCMILIEAEGPDASAAVEALSRLVASGFGEDD